jgi:hypothetical protein
MDGGGVFFLPPSFAKNGSESMVFFLKKNMLVIRKSREE